MNDLMFLIDLLPKDTHLVVYIHALLCDYIYIYICAYIIGRYTHRDSFLEGELLVEQHHHENVENNCHTFSGA